MIENVVTEGIPSIYDTELGDIFEIGDPLVKQKALSLFSRSFQRHVVDPILKDNFMYERIIDQLIDVLPTLAHTGVKGDAIDLDIFPNDSAKVLRYVADEFDALSAESKQQHRLEAIYIKIDKARHIADALDNVENRDDSRSFLLQDDYAIEKATTLLAHFRYTKKVGDKRHQVHLEESFIDSDRDFYRKSPINWVEPRNIYLFGASELLAKVVDEGHSHELGFVANFEFNKNNDYGIYAGNEGVGNISSAKVQCLITKPDSFQKKHSKGLGHTHPVNTTLNMLSGSDMSFISGGFALRPHLLVTPQNAILYLPNKGFYSIPKNKILVDSKSIVEKDLIDIRG